MSLYREIYHDLREQILTHHYAPQSPLPEQTTLATQYHTTRVTIKKALSLLEQEGLVYSKQGSGTYVRSPLSEVSEELLPLDYPVGTTTTHFNQAVTSRVLAFAARLPNKEEQAALKMTPFEPIYDIQRLRLVNDKPYSLEHTRMPTKLATIDESILSHSLYAYLKAQHGIVLTDSRRIISAEAATPTISHALQIETGAPVLVINQTAFDQEGVAFEYSDAYFIPSQTRFVMDVHRPTH